jgi:elongator complex protein 4
LCAFVPRRVVDASATAETSAEESGGVGGSENDARSTERDGRVEEDDGLRIAWQYRRYLKEGRALDDSRVGAASQSIVSASAAAAGTSSSKKKKIFRAPDACGTYDVTKEEDAKTLEDVDVSYRTFSSLCDIDGCDASDEDADVDADKDKDDATWDEKYRFFERFVERIRAGAEEGAVGRCVVQLESPGATNARGWAKCASFIRALKALVHGTNVTALVIVPLMDAPERISALIRHTADCAIDVQPLDGPKSEIESLLPDPHACVGLIAVRKLQFQGAVASPLARMDRVYALQMRRKRMAIKPLQTRPDDDGAGGNGGVTNATHASKGGGSACGAGAGAGLDDF